MAEAVGQPERIDFVTAKQHRVGKPGAAEKHAEHRLLRRAVGQRDQRARDDVRHHVGADEFEHPLERDDRIAAGAEIERD